MGVRSIFTPSDWDSSAWYQVDVINPASELAHWGHVFVHATSNGNWLVTDGGYRHDRITTEEAKHLIRTRRDAKGRAVRLSAEAAERIDSRYWYELTR